jgi:hypothetical protein
VNRHPTIASESTAPFTQWRCAPIYHSVGGWRAGQPSPWRRFNPTTGGKRRNQWIGLTIPRLDASSVRIFFHFFRRFGGFYGEVQDGANP